MAIAVEAVATPRLGRQIRQRKGFCFRLPRDDERVCRVVDSERFAYLAGLPKYHGCTGSPPRDVTWHSHRDYVL